MSLKGTFNLTNRIIQVSNDNL